MINNNVKNFSKVEFETRIRKISEYYNEKCEKDVDSMLMCLGKEYMKKHMKNDTDGTIREKYRLESLDLVDNIVEHYNNEIEKAYKEIMQEYNAKIMPLFYDEEESSILCLYEI